MKWLLIGLLPDWVARANFYVSPAFARCLGHDPRLIIVGMDPYFDQYLHKLLVLYGVDFQDKYPETEIKKNTHY